MRVGGGREERKGGGRGRKVSRGKGWEGSEEEEGRKTRKVMENLGDFGENGGVRVVVKVATMK